MKISLMQAMKNKPKVYIFLLAILLPMSINSYQFSKKHIIAKWHQKEVALNASNGISPLKYKINPLGEKMYLAAEAKKINDHGQTVGWVYENGTHNAYFWRSADAKEIKINLKSPFSEAWSINSQGNIAGISASQRSEHFNGFIIKKYSKEILGALPGCTFSQGCDINDFGVVVGYSYNPGDDYDLTHACLWKDGHCRSIGTLGGKYSEAYQINNKEEVVGRADINAVDFHAFIWKNGKLKDIKVLPGDTSSEARGINDHTQIVGNSYDARRHSHAFLWQAEKMSRLATLDNAISNAEAINNAGVIVGWIEYPMKKEPFAAVVWVDGSLYNLNNLIPMTSEWQLLKATSINNKGEIVGEGIYKGKPTLFFLEPSAY